MLGKVEDNSSVLKSTLYLFSKYMNRYSLGSKPLFAIGKFMKEIKQIYYSILLHI